MRRIAYRSLVAATIALASIATWLVVDEPLDDETRRWLRAPDREGQGRGLEILRELARLRDRGPEVNSEVRHQCMTFDACCLMYARANPDAVSRSTITDPKRRTLYREFLEVDRISLDVADHESSMEVYQSGRDVLLAELFELGTIRPKTVARMLTQHRRQLAQVDSLIAEMIFLAAVGIDAGAANLVLATNENLAGAALEDALAPLTPAEYGFRGAFRGELRRYAEQIITADAPFSWQRLFMKSNHYLNMTRKRHASLIEVSERDWETFWSTEPELRSPSLWDYVFDPIGSRLADVVDPLYIVEYLASVRYLNAQFAATRAMSDIYEHGALDTTPRTPAPALWRWHWDNVERQLCLVPDDVHPAMARYAEPICVSHIIPDPLADCPARR